VSNPSRQFESLAPFHIPCAMREEEKIKERKILSGIL
jgi:hypothetical protein